MKKILFALMPLFMVLAFSIDAYSQDVDRTSLVGTDETFWKRGYDGASGTLCDTKYAPMVTTSDGRTVQLVEDFQWGFNQLEVVLSQKVRGLENGNYTVVLYANAVSTHERDNFEGTPASSGATDVAYVFAGDKKVPVPVKVATVIDVNGEYTIANVEVTDGTLTLGLGTYKTGTNWHTIQIKSLVQHNPAQTFYEWRGGKYTERSVSEIDSITFSLPESNPIQVQANAVDLGLPSGTLWADRNVGADSPEDYGDYFAWGETTPKNLYSWGTYKFYDGSLLKKYHASDKKTCLELSDDAAYVNWGNKWRMPTKEETLELANNCKWTISTRNGVKGFYVTGPNGNSIFMPVAGRYIDDDDGTFESGGVNGGIYSSTIHDESVYSAFCLYFWTEGFMVCGDSRGSRASGRSVRAVVR